MSIPDTTIEETWWEVTTQTGLILLLPAPLTSTGVAINPVNRLIEPRDPIHSTSRITGWTYGLDMSTVLAIRAFVRTEDPERLKRAQMKVSERWSNTSLASGQERASRSDEPGSRSGPSTGGTSKPRTH